MSLVFVYGPDTVQARMYDRVGPSEVIGTASLSGFVLTFNKPNMKRPAEGLANVIEAADRQVFGVLYDLTPKQIESLEGYFGGYSRRRVEVTLEPVDDAESAPIRRSAEMWTARRTKAGLLPSRLTLDLVKKGAAENQAPPGFREELKKVDVLAE